MFFTYFGNPGDVWEDAFLTSPGGFTPAISSSSITRVVLSNAASGYVTTLAGSGFGSLSAAPRDGLVTRITITDGGGREVARITDIAWEIDAFFAAINAKLAGNAAPLGALVAPDELVLEARGATTGLTAAFTGLAAPILFYGSAQADRVRGGAGDDNFLPLGGNDTLSGGGGWDRLRYDQDGVDPGLEVDLAAGTARGSWAGTAFSQRVSGFESVQGSDHGDRIAGSAASESLFGGAGADMLFADGFDAIYTPDEAAKVYRLYQATLNRAPDAGGQTNWTERLFTGELGVLHVIEGFVKSREFHNLYGTVDDSGFVTLLYRNVLGRAPDATGLASWTDRLEAGMSRAEVVRGFSESPEFIDRSADDARAYIAERSQPGWSDDVFRLYQAVLDRAPDLAGFENWTERLAGGMKLQAAVDGFVRSAEFQDTYGAVGNKGFVTLLYQNVLGRAPDATGLANWTARLDGGMSRAEVVTGFSQSAEFVATTQGALKAWMRGLDHGFGNAWHDWVQGDGGNNYLGGGLYADVFEFTAGERAGHWVLDLEPWDYLAFEEFDYSSPAEARSHMTQQGEDVVFSDQQVTIRFQHTTLPEITADMIWV